ncbi:MAG: hypothetical protein GWP74_16895 [Proteobacteria bacterium]|nr:hypothetical protein [Pseudomonadota bacterium]
MSGPSNDPMTGPERNALRNELESRGWTPAESAAFINSMAADRRRGDIASDLIGALRTRKGHAADSPQTRAVRGKL